MGSAGEDISAFIFEASWEYERDYASQLNGRRVRITMQIGNSAEVTMWACFLESITPSVRPMVRVSTAELLAYGSLAHRSLQGQVSVPMHSDIKTGEAITEVLD